MPHAIRITKASRSAGGHTAVATAMSKPTVNMGCGRAGWSSSSSIARTNAPSTNGASAKQTSGPSSPRHIALRAMGLAAYATVAATAGSAETRERPHQPVRAPRAER